MAKKYAEQPTGYSGSTPQLCTSQELYCLKPKRLHRFAKQEGKATSIGNHQTEVKYVGKPCKPERYVLTI